MNNTIKYIAGCVISVTATGVFYKHSDHRSHSADNPAPASYAGLQERAIKALSTQEAQDFIDGKGMGLTKAAELKSHPGPDHVRELLQLLHLTQTAMLSPTRITQYNALRGYDAGATRNGGHPH